MNWSESGLTVMFGDSLVQIYPATIAVFLIALVVFVAVSIVILRNSRRSDAERDNRRSWTEAFNRLRLVHALIALLLVFAIWQVFQIQVPESEPVRERPRFTRPAEVSVPFEVSPDEPPRDSITVTPPIPDEFVLTGTVTHVRDGDTIEVADVPVRLNGVAAPELNERFGREGKQFMARLVNGKTVRCELNGERSGDRVIGVCFLDGEDIGAAIIAAGLARDCPRYSGGRYNRFNTPASTRLPLPNYC